MKISHLILMAIVALAPPIVRADGPGPTVSIAAERYESLWSKSPFAVATPDTVAEASPDYFLVGVASEDGVFYASVIDRRTQEHFLLCSDKAVRGMTLKSITRTLGGQATFAEVLKGEQALTLELEQPPASAVSSTLQIPTPSAERNGTIRPARVPRSFHFKPSATAPAPTSTPSSSP